MVPARSPWNYLKYKDEERHFKCVLLSDSFSKGHSDRTIVLKGRFCRIVNVGEEAAPSLPEGAASRCFVVCLQSAPERAIKAYPSRKREEPPLFGRLLSSTLSERAGVI